MKNEEDMYMRLIKSATSLSKSLVDYLSEKA